MLLTNNPALIIIDMQNAIDEFSKFERNNLSMEAKLGSFLVAWREKGLSVVHVRHSSKFEESPYHRDSAHYSFKDEVMPVESETVITKQENSAFVSTALDSVLKESEIHEIVVCGVLVNHSIDATVRVGAALGYKVFLPADLTASFGMKLLNNEIVSAEQVHNIFLSNLHTEYCKICDSHQLLSCI